jgi:RsiW-degrading membrane proteinase PrsW (M82 family)
MNNPQEPTLQWLAQQHFEEQRSLRNAEDNLFNWSTSVFLAGLGALTSLKGFSTGSWDLWWRLFLMLAVVVVIGVILSMAYLIRRNYNQNAQELQQVLSQIRPTGSARTGALETELYFYLRWSALAALGGVTLILLWMLG